MKRSQQDSADLSMTEIKVVKFETSPCGETHLSELSDGPPFTVHGVALGADDITVGQSGIKKLWPSEELEKAADTLRGTNLVVDHNNDATGVVGRVTKSGYKEETGVVYEAELFDEDLAEKIKNGLLEVSIRGFHADVDSLEEDDETDAKVVEDIKFDNLSIVPTGAAPSNTLEMGEHAELSAAELSAFTESLESVSNLQEIEPGMWVKSNGTKGITISQVQDGEIEVDIYEESDGKWRSTGETEMFDTNSLDEWDVDEEEDIGAREDEEDSESEEENAPILEAGIKFFDTINDSMHTIASVEGNMVTIQGEDGSEWTETKEDVFEKISQGEWEKAGHGEMAAESLEASDGDFVQWKGVNDEMMFGQIVSINQDGQQMVADIRRFTKSGDSLDEIVQKPIQGLEKWDRMHQESDTSDNNTDSPDDMRDDPMNGVEPPTWEDGQMVKWQVNPAMRGKIVHVDREKKNIMVEVMHETEQGLQSTGFTVTAGYSDLIPMDEEVASVTTRDTPSQDAKPSHDTDSVKNLLTKFVEEVGSENPSLEEFADWMGEENLQIERGEGEEEAYTSKAKRDDGREMQPERFVEAEDEDSSELEERYSDYPEAASENAQMALDAREETGNPNDCGTDVGWKRANQLANGEGLTREQVGKMSAFNRHRSNSEMSDEEGEADCGWMMWKAWGGDEGVDWAQEKLDSIEENAMDDVPSDMIFSSREDAEAKADDLGLSGVHEMDGRWMPGETHKELMDNISSNSGHGDMEEEAQSASASEDSDGEELQDYEMHTPDWSGTTTSDWSSPDMEDFDTDDLEEIAAHFLISSTGFPPENFGDLKLPVVEPNGDLNVNALAAVKGGRGVSAVDGLASDMEEEIVDWVNSTANEEFDKDWGMEEEAAAHEISGTAGRPTASKSVGGVRVLSGDDLRQSYKSEESDVDSIEELNIITMTEDIEEKLSQLDEPVAVEAAEVEELRNKADRFEEMSENLEALRERTDILDEVDRSQVEELAESEDPIVKESSRYEELQAEAEQVAGVYAAQLSEQYPAFSAEELTDKFSIEELREKFESEIGDVEEELASSDNAEPRSQDADEESLEENADEADESEAELSDEVAEKQEEILSKIRGGNR